MPNPYLEFTDSVGLARLTCLVPILSGWTPDIDPVGPNATALGTGQRYQFTFRTDQVAKFRFPYIQPAQVTELLRLKSWLLDGNTITLFTGDLAGRIYTVRLREGTEPTIEQDPDSLEFTLGLEVVNTVAAPLLALWLGTALLMTPSTDYLGLGGTYARATVAAYMTGP